jgi:hypothetical protein
VQWPNNSTPIAIREIHTAAGKHKIEVAVFPVWIPFKGNSSGYQPKAGQAGEMLGIGDLRSTRKHRQ